MYQILLYVLILFKSVKSTLTGTRIGRVIHIAIIIKPFCTEAFDCSGISVGKPIYDLCCKENSTLGNTDNSS